MIFTSAMPYASTMSDNGCTVRFLSDSAFNLEPKADTECDLITFLAAVQAAKIDILQVTWQAARQPISKGVTSYIHEALMTLRINFAFKCVKEEQKVKKSKAEIFQTFITEIAVLSHPLIRKHPHIVELEGICWDITSEDEVWPVLIFEKSKCGDLNDFITSHVGRNLGIVERLNLCIDVGTAIVDMHDNKIIHQDIKPENILVFEAGSGGYTARVTDFGYSTRFANEDDGFTMPKSWPWNAPEHHHRKFRPAQARKMDLFSLGMVCLWLVFEKYLSGIVPLPQEVLWLEPYIQSCDEKHRSKSILQAAKDENKLVQLARQLVMAERDLEDYQKEQLRRFFDASLVREPNLREFDLKQAFGSVFEKDEDKIIQLLSELVTEGEDLDSDQKEALRQSLANDPNFRDAYLKPAFDPDLDLENFRSNMLNYSFEIMLSIDSLYQSDYRLRQYIRHCLVKRVSTGAVGSITPKNGNIAFQLALCYKIGFGIASNDSLSQEMLLKSGRTQDELDGTIHRINQWKSESRLCNGSNYTALLALGQFRSNDSSDQYRVSGKLKDAEAELKREIRDIDRHAEKDNPITTFLVGSLSLLFAAQGRWKEAEEFARRSVETEKRVLGEEHPETLTSMSNLAFILNRQGQGKEAETLWMRILEIGNKKHDSERQSTVTSMSSLASIYSAQGQWTKAENFQIQVLKIRKRIFGEEHSSTLSSMDELASTYRHQGSLKKAEELEMRVIEILGRTQGEYHPTTLKCIGNLASVYSNQGRWKEAEELEVRVLETLQRIQGETHPDTLTAMGNLSLTYRDQGKGKKAEELGTRVVKMKKQVLGEDHPDTLIAMGNLALVYRDQERWEEAKELCARVMEMRKRVLGEEHPFTLNSMNQLAVTLKKQGQAKEAISLMADCVRIREHALGPDHPNTMSSRKTLERWRMQSADLYTREADGGVEGFDDQVHR